MIPVCKPLIAEREKALVLDCLKSGWVSSAGKYLDQFESDWAAYCGMKHGIGVSNGTVALELAMEVIELEPGDLYVLCSDGLDKEVEPEEIAAVLERGEAPLADALVELALSRGSRDNVTVVAVEVVGDTAAAQDGDDTIPGATG